MKRRDFIALAFLLLIIPITKDSSANSWDIIKATLLHLFPKNKKFVGADELNLIHFLKIVSQDKSFNKDDLKILISGAKELLDLNRDFIKLHQIEKEKILREFEKKEFGQNWLSKIMNYGIEGMFGDPIYGGNKNMLGWKAIGHNAGFPRPKGRYGI